MTRSTFAFWIVSKAAGNSYLLHGVCLSASSFSSLCYNSVSGPRRVVYGLGCLWLILFLRKSPSRSLRPSVWFLSPRPAPTPSLDLCNKTINTDGYKMQPNTFGFANRLHGRARGSAANGNKIASSVFFRMHGCVLGPLNMCVRFCHNPCVYCCR